MMGVKFAKEFNIPYTIYYPNWVLYGRRAGFIENKAMLNDSSAEQVIVFWDGTSKGTKHMIDISEQLGIVVHVICY